MAGEGRTGKDFGDYELLEEIARGGMGMVYKSRQKSLDRIVAVKLLLSGPHAEAEFIKRFRIEASAAAALQHPNIVAIHEVGVHEGEHFIAMEFVDGPNLAKLVKEQPLPPTRAAGYLKTIAEAIQFAHERGILHRDLKPSNVLLDAHDQPRVTDFGLAKRVGTESQPVTEESQLTLSGQMIGTPSYMSPEQATGRRGAMGRRGDVYSLGAMLYHLLTGRPPFVGVSLAETLQQVETREPVALRLFNPVVPFDLETICLKCLEKEPARRYATARDLAEELGRFILGESILARPIGRTEKAWRWCRRKPVVAALGVALLLVGLAGLGGVLGQWRRAERNAASAVTRQRQAEQAGRDLQCRSAEDSLIQGRAAEALAQLALVLRNDPTHRVAATRAISALSQRSFALPLVAPFRHEGPVRNAVFSPDGRFIATASKDRTARVWDVRTGQPVTMPLSHLGYVLDAGFSPDGRRLVTATGGWIARVWEVEDGRLVTALTHKEGELRGARFRADGRSVLTWTTATVHLWSLAGSATSSVVMAHASAIRSVRLNTDGTRVVTAAKDGVARIWNPASGELIASFDTGRELYHAEFSLDGQRVVTAGDAGVVRVWNVATGTKVTIRLADSLPVGLARFDPGGRTVVTVSPLGVAECWDADTGRPVGPPLRHRAAVVRAEFSPDGRRLLTVSGDGQAWVWDHAAGRLGCEPLSHDGAVNAACFSPDGRAVLTAGEDGTAQLWDVRPGEQLAQRFVHARTVRRVAFSPDGARLATASYDGTARLWDARSGQPLSPPLEHQGRVWWAGFDPAGRQLLTVGADQMARLWDGHDGRPRRAPISLGAVAEHAEFSPDGTRFVTAGRNGQARLWDAATGAPVGAPMPHGAHLLGARFSPDGRRVVTAGKSDFARLWDVATGAQIGEGMKHDGDVLHAEFSPDGTRVVTSSLDNTARLWDGRTAQPLGEPIKPNAGGRAARFSPDGRWLIVLSSDNTARLLDARTGQPVGQPFNHEAGIYWCEFSPTSDAVATASLDGTARLRDVPSGRPLSEPLDQQARAFEVRFDPTGRWIASAGFDGSARLWEAPAQFHPAPAWLPRLAEAVARQRLLPDGSTRFLDGGEFNALKAHLLASALPPDEVRWLHWFFGDRDTRPISPHSTTTLPEYIAQRRAEAAPLSRREAERLAPPRAP